MGDVLVGLDGGGTHTRVLVAGTDGEFLGYAEDAGCNPEYEQVETCVEHAKGALTGALAIAGAPSERVRAFVGGIAGLGATRDGGQWAHRIASDIWSTCKVSFTGDNNVAQFGAFAGAPGIVAIGGTGSIVFAATDTGREICNFDLGHNAAAGAWWLSHRTVVRLAAGEDGPEDAAFVREILSALGSSSVSDLRDRLLNDRGGLNVSALAPLVTSWAERGAPLARAVCDETADELARGVRLLLAFFHAHPVPVAPIGSVASSAYMQGALARRVAESGGHLRFAVPLYPPVVGAVLMAARLAERHLSVEAAHRLAVRMSEQSR